MQRRWGTGLVQPRSHAAWPSGKGSRLGSAGGGTSARSRCPASGVTWPDTKVPTPFLYTLSHILDARRGILRSNNRNASCGNFPALEIHTGRNRIHRDKERVARERGNTQPLRRVLDQPVRTSHRVE